MAFKVAEPWCLAFALLYLSVFSCKIGKADEDLLQPGEEDHEDPAQLVAKALLCFDDKFIYSSCDEAYRLNEKGNLHVPPEYTDLYCSGPCFAETNLVLTCIDNILSKFVFYNKATIGDVRDTVKAGCSHGSERGDFDVAEHIHADESNAHKAAVPFLLGLVLVLQWRGLLL